MLVIYNAKTGKVLSVLPHDGVSIDEDGMPTANGKKLIGEGCSFAVVPWQEVPVDEYGTIVATYPNDFQAVDAQALSELIDAGTDKRITASMHKTAGTGESIGAIRDMVVQIINAIGLEPTDDFKRLNEIAIAAIKEAAARKAKL